MNVCTYVLTGQSVSKVTTVDACVIYKAVRCMRACHIRMPLYRSMYDVPLAPVKPSQSEGETGGGGGGTTPKRSTTSTRAASKVELKQTQKGKGKKKTVSKYEDDDDYDVDDDDEDNDESIYNDDSDYDDDDDDGDYTDTVCDDDDVDDDDDDDNDYNEANDDGDDAESGVDDDETSTTVRGKASSTAVSKSKKSKKTVTSATTPTRAIKPSGLQQHDVARVFSKYMQLSKSERTEAMIAPEATADIHVLSLIAKQILSKQIKLPGGVKVRDGLPVLADGSLEQKRSILITQPSLLSAMIKKSKVNCKPHRNKNQPDQQQRMDHRGSINMRIGQ